MEDEKVKRITALAEDLHNKRMRFQSLGMQNTAHLSPDEAKQRAIEYHLAHAEYLEAVALLESAKEPS